MSDATEQSPIPHVTVVSDPSDSHRTKTIKELVSTEIIYVNLLNDIVEVNDPLSTAPPLSLSLTDVNGSSPPKSFIGIHKASARRRSHPFPCHLRHLLQRGTYLLVLCSIHTKACLLPFSSSPCSCFVLNVLRFHCSFLSDLGSFLQTLNDESIMSDIFLKKV